MRPVVVRATLIAAFASFVLACGNAPDNSRKPSELRDTPATEAAPVKPAAASSAPTRAASASPRALTRADVLAARRKYVVRVLSFDASQQFGAEMPYSDFVRLRIINNSGVVLPCLTILTKRYATGQMVGSSRAPSIPTADLAPGQSVEYDYYPRGHLDVVRVDRITVEIEGIINPDAEQFFCELQRIK